MRGLSVLSLKAGLQYSLLYSSAILLWSLRGMSNTALVGTQRDARIDVRLLIPSNTSVGLVLDRMLYFPIRPFLVTVEVLVLHAFIAHRGFITSSFFRWF